MMDVSKTIENLPKMSEQAIERLRANVRDWLASDDEARREAAAEVEDAIEALYAPAGAADYDTLSPDDRRKRLRHAFARRPASETEAKVIAALVRHPGSTSAELTRRVGWEGQAWHAHFGAACRDREDLLWTALPSETRDAAVYSSILADFEPDGATFRVRRDLAGTLGDIVGATPPADRA